MNIIISFNYRSKKYQYTINDCLIDMTHYDDVWDFWVGENNNDNQYYDFKNEEQELVFEVTANKKFTDNNKELISGDGIYINVYANIYADEYMDIINRDEIEVLYQ